MNRRFYAYTLLTRLRERLQHKMTQTHADCQAAALTVNHMAGSKTIYMSGS